MIIRFVEDTISVDELREIAKEYYMERTSLFYLANLGSEVNRIFTLKEKGLVKESEGAYARAMGIVEKLLNHPDLEGRTAEIKMLRDYLKQSMESEQVQSFKKEWQGYFSPYANRLFSNLETKCPSSRTSS